MTIKVEQHSDITILKLRGSFIGSPGVELFEKAIFPLLKKEMDRIILDLHQVMIIDSAGLGAMVATMVSIKRRGGALKLAGVEGELQRIVENMHLNKVFAVYDTVEEAEKSFQAKRDA